MDTTLSIRVDKELKEGFKNYSSDLGVDSSMLIRKFMTSCIKRKETVKIDIDELILDEIVTSDKSLEKLNELGNILSKKVC